MLTPDNVLAILGDESCGLGSHLLSRCLDYHLLNGILWLKFKGCLALLDCVLSENQLIMSLLLFSLKPSKLVRLTSKVRVLSSGELWCLGLLGHYFFGSDCHCLLGIQQLREVCCHISNR